MMARQIASTCSTASATLPAAMGLRRFASRALMRSQSGANDRHDDIIVLVALSIDHMLFLPQSLGRVDLCDRELDSECRRRLQPDQMTGAEAKTKARASHARSRPGWTIHQIELS